VPAYTFVADSIRVAAVRAVPIIVNVDSRSGSAARYERRITPRTKAIIPVHIDRP